MEDAEQPTSTPVRFAANVDVQRVEGVPREQLEQMGAEWGESFEARVLLAAMATEVRAFISRRRFELARTAPPAAAGGGYKQ